MRVSDRYLPSRLAFAALDFETADVHPETACAVAVVRVSEGRVGSVRRWLLRPPEGARFRFTALHGIGEAQTHDAKAFSVIGRHIASDLARAAFVAAHHARLDAEVLSALAHRRSIQSPRRPFVCTARLFGLALGRRGGGLP